MSYYFYGGVNITDLVLSGSTAVPNYVGFPTSTAPTYNTSGFDKPYNFSYTIGNTDVSNYATAYSLNYNSGSDLTIPISIPSNPGYNFKHISAYCWGGGGGGGGGGGNGDTSFGYTAGGRGGDGAPGGCAAIIDYPIGSSTVNYKVGSGGSGGDGGSGATPGSNNAGKNGDAGADGGTSYVKVGNTDIVTGTGGDSGSGGGSGNGGSDGGNGAPGTYVAGSYYNTPNTPYVGTTSQTPPATEFPSQGYGGYGGGGGAGSPDGVPTNSPGYKGGTGAGGYVQVYLTYQA